MKVYQTDRNGYFVGETYADEDPLTPGEYLIPGGCVTDAPPELEGGKSARITPDGWVIVEIPRPDAPDEGPPPEQDPKLTGIDFNGAMCSATAEDQHGLAAVLVAIQFQGAAFQPTRFHFANGNTLVISLDNWQDFAAVWLPFRQSFFAVEAEE